jgi:hypothetical protein
MKKIKILLTIFMVTAFVQTNKAQQSMYYGSYGVSKITQDWPEWCFFACMEMLSGTDYLYGNGNTQCYWASEYGNLPSNGYSTGCCDRYSGLPYSCRRGVSTNEAGQFIRKYAPRYAQSIDVAFPDIGYDEESYKLPCIVADDRIHHAYVADMIVVNQGDYFVYGQDPAPGVLYASYNYIGSNVSYAWPIVSL